jgi:hypothetical protein
LDNGFVYNNDLYYREGLELTLANNLSEKTGYHITYKASYNNGNKTFTGNTYTVNSTDGDVTLTDGRQQPGHRQGHRHLQRLGKE